MTSGPPRRIGDAALYGALALGLAAVFVPLAIFRLVDADEGIYLANARMVMEGRMPFRDFHYPQMFLLPYLYAGWMKITGVSWYAGRLLSVLFTVALGLALHHHVVRHTGRRAWGVLAVLVFATSSLGFPWYPLVKTYAFGTLVLFLSYSVLSWGPERWRYLLSGVLLGLGVDTRLYVVAVVPIIVLAALGERERRRHVALFATGLGLALLPNLYFVLFDPAVFVFNVVGHHAIRSDSGLIGATWQKAEAVLNMIGINGSFGATSFQFTLLVVVTLCLAVASGVTWSRLPRSLVIAIVIFVVSLLPTPTYGQYFCMFLPFLVVAMVELVVEISNRVSVGALARPLHRMFWALLAVYVLVSPIDVYWYTGGGDIVPGVFTKENAKNWTIPAINRVARAIDAAMPPGGTTVISWWPGYLVETRAEIFPRLANPNTFWYAHRLTAQEVVRYQFVSHPELMWQIRTHRVPVVVLGNWAFGAKPIYAAVLAESGYVEVTDLGDTKIYRWDPGDHSNR